MWTDSGDAVRVLLVCALLFLGMAAAQDYSYLPDEPDTTYSYTEAVSDITASLAVTAGDNTVISHGVTVTLEASSPAGDITTEIWDCDNGAASAGAHPLAGSLALPNWERLPGQVDLPTQAICYYKVAGIYHPRVAVYDSRGSSALATTVLTVAD